MELLRLSIQIMEIPIILFKKRNIHIYLSVKFAHAERNTSSSRSFEIELRMIVF